MTTKRSIQLIDWSERFPEETARQIAVRQSTVCLCGKPKEIGATDCGCDYALASQLKG